MPKGLENFATAFKVLRLKSQIDSLRELGELLDASGFTLEESTLSRWQSGARVPKKRELLIALIKIFALRNAISTIEEANRLLQLAGLVPLSEIEEENLALNNGRHVILSLPPPPDIIGTSDTMEAIRRFLEAEGGHLRVVLYGLPGTGKSSTAISVAHQFLSYFDKGVIWLRVLDRSMTEIESMLSDILLANTPKGLDTTTPLSMIRSKNFLLVLDNVESEQSLAEIADHFSSSSYIVTTSTYPNVTDHFHTLEVKPFEDIYIYEVFSRSAGRQLTSQEKGIVKKIASQLGNLPLPLSIVANTLKNRLNEESLEHTLQLLKAKGMGLSFFQENFTRIVSAFEVLFDQLTDNEKIVLQAIASKRLPVFEIASLEVKSLNPSIIQWALFTLSSKSLLDKTDVDSYRIHPLLYRFLRIKSGE
jgi:hypothetical protein